MDMLTLAMAKNYTDIQATSLMFNCFIIGKYFGVVVCSTAFELIKMVMGHGESWWTVYE